MEIILPNDYVSDFRGQYRRLIQEDDDARRVGILCSIFLFLLFANIIILGEVC